MTGAVSCLGPVGSYSELAAQKLAPDSRTLLCADFYEVLDKLLDKEVDCAVLPIENSIQGGVLINLDLLEKAPVFAEKELVLPIDHRLAVREGVSRNEIERIYSHEQAIGQCAQYLRRFFPHARYLFTRSTAESLEKIDEHSAGIVGSHIRAKGIVLSEENIADEKRNFTRFLRLVRQEDARIKASEKVFFCAVCRHEPGTLLELLSVFADCGINLTRIESRPIKDVFGEYRFFIEIDGNIGSGTVRRALRLAEEKCRQFRVIGAY